MKFDSFLSGNKAAAIHYLRGQLVVDYFIDELTVEEIIISLDLQWTVDYPYRDLSDCCSC